MPCFRCIGGARCRATETGIPVIRGFLIPRRSDISGIDRGSGRTVFSNCDEKGRGCGAVAAGGSDRGLPISDRNSASVIDIVKARPILMDEHDS